MVPLIIWKRTDLTWPEEYGAIYHLPIQISIIKFRGAVKVRGRVIHKLSLILKVKKQLMLLGMFHRPQVHAIKGRRE